MAHVSDIKLIRTDTTLDLSQKAEKGMIFSAISTPFYTLASSCFLALSDVGQTHFLILTLLFINRVWYFFFFLLVFIYLNFIII